MIITTDNYEEFFYRYQEHELTEAERDEVETFVAAHPELADELSLYDPSLKLAAVPVTCPDKDGLLHPSSKVVPLWRWVVAACMAAGLLCLPLSRLWDRPSPKFPVSTLNVADARQMPVSETEDVLSSVSEKNGRLLAEKKPVAASIEPSVVEPLKVPLDEPVVLSLSDPVDVSELLAEVAPSALQEDTTVIEYIDITPAPIGTIQVAMVVDEGAGTPFRGLVAFGHRCGNYLRDYAYQAGAEMRGRWLSATDRKNIF